MENSLAMQEPGSGAASALHEQMLQQAIEEARRLVARSRLLALNLAFECASDQGATDTACPAEEQLAGVERIVSDVESVLRQIQHVRAAA